MTRIVAAAAFAGVVGLAAWFAVNPRVGVIVALVVGVGLVPLLGRTDDES